MNIGVLALQGDFAEHIKVLRRLGVDAQEVRLPHELDALDGLIIPGGESTTIGKLAVAYDLIEPLKQFGKEKPLWGTCAGAIFISKDAQREQPLLGLMDIKVERNAFGRQVDSFETDLDVDALKRVDQNNPPYHAIFIRAPLIKSLDGDAQGSRHIGRWPCSGRPARVICWPPLSILNSPMMTASTAISCIWWIHESPPL